jgi:isopentenyl diphosphate isomerase/L-lactate dehydrogenase-like FMN-dependent dehydrogenase
VEAPLTLTDLELRARERLEPEWAEYIAGGAGAERSLRANIDAFGAWQLRQRVLCGIDAVSTVTTVLGQDVRSPVIVAPVAYQAKAHTEGEAGMARAAARAGSALCLSTFANATMEDVAAAAPDGVRFLQVYVFRDHAVTSELIAQAVELGFSAVFLTVDLPVLGPRDRERRIRWVFDESSMPAVRYAIGRGIPGDGMEILDPALDWAYLDRLASSVPVPIVVKGVLDPADAVLAAEHGAAGVVVSNHGGRQLDGASSTLDALPVVVDRVGDRIEVLFDGGIRRGADVAVALALGARAVLAGRAPVWGLAAGGEDGAATVLELLRDELVTALHLMGCRSLTELGLHNVARTAPPRATAPGHP